MTGMFREMLTQFQHWLRSLIANDVIRRKPVITRIRHEFALLGYDLSDLTDEDIRQGVLHMSEVFQSYGVTAEEATKALTNLYHGI